MLECREVFQAKQCRPGLDTQMMDTNCLTCRAADNNSSSNSDI